MHHPRSGHIEAVKYVGKHNILSTMDLGLHFSSKSNFHLNLSHISHSRMMILLLQLHLQVSMISVMLIGDLEKPLILLLPISITCPLMSFDPSVDIYFFMGGGPILWKTYTEKQFSHSSCEVKSKTLTNA
jgi:hypothetical protein